MNTEISPPWPRRRTSVARHPKAVIGVAEHRRNAAARGTARDADVVAPRASPRRAPGAVRGAFRIRCRRGRIVAWVIPVRAPFVHVFAHVEKTEAIGGRRAYPLGAVPPAGGIIGARLRILVPPRIKAAGQTARSRPTPIRPRWGAENGARAASISTRNTPRHQTSSPPPRGGTDRRIPASDETRASRGR